VTQGRRTVAFIERRSAKSGNRNEKDGGCFMKRRFALLSVLITILGMILIVPAASSQDANAGTVNVPFSFVANHQVLPAGCYHAKLLSNAILTLANCQTGRTVGVMVHTTNGYPTIRHGSMVFRVATHENRLVQVRFPGINIESDLSVQSKPERELASGTANKTTEIAMISQRTV
jgi:hypothetical protein